MTLTKADIVELIITQVGLSRDDARNLVDETLEEIRSALVAGDTVKLSGFGNFEVREKKQRPGRNPKTGEEIPIAARKVVSFKAGQKLKIRVASTKPNE